MRYLGIALVSIIAGIGGGLMTYGLSQPSFDQTATIIAAAVNPNSHVAISSARRDAEDRAVIMGIGVGFLSCGATAVALSFLTTIVDYNLRNRPGGQ